MKQSADLKRLLTSIDHKSYPAYKDVRGAYDGVYLASFYTCLSIKCSERTI